MSSSNPHRFAKANAASLAPHAVRAQDFDRFGEDLTETTREDLARNVYLLLCNTWDEAVDAYPHWPRVRPEHTLRRLWYTTPWETYPAALLAEIDRLFEARRNCDRDRPSPWRAPLGPEAERTQRAYLRRFLHALCQTGRSPEQLTSLSTILTPEHVDDALGWMLLRSGNDPKRDVYNIAVLLRSIARNCLSLDQRTHKEFDEIVESYYPERHQDDPTISARTQDFLLRLEDPILRRSLLGIPQRVFDRHATKDALSRSDSVEVQAALAIALAIATVLDPTRLAALQLERDIVCRLGEPAVFRATEIGQLHAEEEFPPTVTQLLDLHLSKARTRLQPDAATNLFPGAHGRSKLPVVLTRQVGDLVKRECGIRITASQFKWVVGFLHLKQHPT